MQVQPVARPHTKIEFNPESLQYCVELWLGETKLMTNCYNFEHSAQMAQSQLELAISLAVNHGVEQLAS